jgi:lysophospholipase L1-like esterase
LNNSIYAKETIESLIYRRDGFSIAMLGDSLTCHNNWGELLNRDDIANFGIGGNTTEAIIKRINDVNLVSPKKCFIMAGINDIFAGKSTEEIIGNFELIIKYLRENNVEIIIQSTLNVSAPKDNYREINKRVNDLNDSLKKLAAAENIKYVDINRILSMIIC